MEAMREIMFGNWGPMEPEGIFGAKTGRMAFYAAHKEVIDNLFNDSYWGAKMTPQHKEMRKHPNRSAKWIPREILKERDEMFLRWCSYILLPRHWSDKDSWTWGEDEVCLICGTDQEQCKARLVAEKDTEGTTYFPSITHGWCNFCFQSMNAKIKQITKDISHMANI